MVDFGLQELPSSLFELLAAGVGDLLVGRAHLRGVNLAATELLLGSVESYFCQLVLRKLCAVNFTFVNIVLLACRTGARVGARVGALAAELGSESRKLIHSYYCV
jgi:hypothetical protein